MKLSLQILPDEILRYILDFHPFFYSYKREYYKVHTDYYLIKNRVKINYKDFAHLQEENSDWIDIKLRDKIIKSEVIFYIKKNSIINI